ncbi:hypothetical protein BASA81_002643 [Batrachochytrium salamandrivorans]|nr:hypothetical protein BASA81_002643 [Batrachochytrium salamandrivorans]
MSETEEPIVRDSHEKRIMYALSYMAKDKRLNMDDANEMVTELFPEGEDAEYLGSKAGKKVKNHFRKFIPWALTVLNKNSIEEALKDINVIYTKLYPMKSSLDTILSPDVRNPLKLRFGLNSKEHKMAKSLVKITYEEKTTLLKAQRDKVYENYANRLDFAADEIVAVIKDNINSSDPMKRAIVLLIASGCRPIELFERASFKVNKEMGPNWVWQDYLAKKKPKGDEPKPDEGELLTKPIIYLSASDFIKELASVRKELQKQYPKFTQDNGQLSSTIGSRGNKAAKEIFNYKEGLTLYTTRKLYGHISYELYRKTTELFGKNPGYGVWLNNVLGHSKNSLNTALNYSTVDVSTDKVSPQDMVIKQAVLENKVEDLEERLDQDLIPKVPEKPQNYSTTNKIILDQFKLIDVVYEGYIKANNKVPSQAALEKLAKGKAPRTVIRLYYKQKK